jgi:hypothetical protein
MAETTTAAAETPESGERERSTVVFTYNDLDDAVTVAKGVHQVGGSSCEADALAAHLNMAATGGGFRMKLLAAKTFGLINYTKDAIRLTPLGQRACDAALEPAARAEAFLNVELFLKIYEKYKGWTLPPSNEALEAEMVTLGVAAKQKDKARQVFQRSAKQAGFFAHGPTKLIKPSIGAPIPSEIPKDEEKDKSGKGGDGGGGDYPPFIKGLLKSLPAEGAEWKLDARRKWLQLAANAFDLMYVGENESREIQITIKDA